MERQEKQIRAEQTIKYKREKNKGRQFTERHTQEEETVKIKQEMTYRLSKNPEQPGPFTYFLKSNLGH